MTEHSSPVTALLPCPFCGPGQSMVDPWFDDAAKRWAVGAQAQEFLSPKYASNQPFGSTCERFACEQVAKAIRALSVTSTEREPLVFSGERDPFNSIVDWAKEQTETVTSTNSAPAVCARCNGTKIDPYTAREGLSCLRCYGTGADPVSVTPTVQQPVENKEDSAS